MQGLQDSEMLVGSLILLGGSLYCFFAHFSDRPITDRAGKAFPFWLWVALFAFGVAGIARSVSPFFFK